MRSMDITPTEKKIREILRTTKVRYSDEEVVNYCVSLINTGSGRGSATASGVNYATARDWEKQQWFSDLMEVLKLEHQKKLDAKITSLLDESLKELKDRLENGDVNPRTGERVPVSASQIASIVGTLYDKRALIRGEPTSRTERISVDQQLNRLHKRFEEIGKGVNPVPKLTELEEASDNVKH